jgi:hypothetical protein
MIEYREEWMTGRSYISEKALNAQREDLVSEQRVVVFSEVGFSNSVNSSSFTGSSIVLG